MLAGVASPPPTGSARPSAATLVATGLALLRTAPANVVRDALASLGAAGVEPVTPGDDVVARPAVALVARGLLDAAVLPSDSLLELAAVRGDAAPPATGADLRHEYLGLALRRSEAPRVHVLASRLLRAVAADPVVAAASALRELSSGAAIAPDAPAALLARDPLDPLLAATALQLAERVGDHAVASRARTALAALRGPPTVGSRPD